MGQFVMPSLGADMAEGTLVEWLVKPGDRVTRGAAVAVVETQKGAIEIECFETGMIDRLEAQIGQTLPVGALLAVVVADHETAPAPGPTIAAVPPVQAVAPVQPLAAPLVATVGAPPPSSPAARQRAADAGIDLRAIKGSGPAGAVILADVEARLSATPAPISAAPGRKPGLDLTEMRKAIAAAMSRSKREIPHYYLSHQFDLQPATDWLAATNANRPPETRLLMGALLLKATALAATTVPEMNGTFENGGFLPSVPVNAGLVVALRGGGLIAPAIADAALLSLDGLMAAMSDVVARARSGHLRNSELTRGTITVSSLGDAGAEALIGVIYPPQVALVGFGTPQLRPWLRGEAIVPRKVITVTLAADHRVSDGRQGARLLAQIETRLQEPEKL